MSSQHEDNAEQELIEVELHNFFGITGLALFLAWVLFLCMPMMTPANMSVTELLYFRTSAVLGNLIMSILACFIWSKLYSKTGTVIMVVCCACFAPLPAFCVFMTDAAFSFCLVCWFLAGVASACFLMFWGSFLSYHKHKKALLYPAVVTIVVAFMILFPIFLSGADILVVIAAAPVLSTLFFILERRYVSPEKRKSVFDYFGYDAGLTTVSIKSQVMPSIVGTFASSLLLGFALYYFCNFESPALIICVFLALIISSSFRIYDSFTKERYEIKQDIKYLGVVAGIGLFPLAFIGGTGLPTILALFFILLFSFLNHLVGWTAIAEFTRVNGFPPYWNFASGRVGDTAGLAVGFVCGYLTFGSELQASLSTPYIPSLIVLFLILVQSFILKDGYSPLFTRSDGFIGNADALGIEDGQLGEWRRKRLMFADTYNLSPRETEVMILMAKGYNAKHVQERLSISDHTVRAHIYNIYRKVDIHSKQELIDRIESFDNSNA